MTRPILFIISIGLFLSLAEKSQANGWAKASSGLPILHHKADSTEMAESVPVEMDSVEYEEATIPDTIAVADIQITQDSIPAVDSTQTETAADTTKRKREKIEFVNEDFAIDLMVDYLKLTTFALEFQTKFEAGINVIIKKRLSLAVEAGYGDLRPKPLENVLEYQSVGTYYRAGIDYLLQYDVSNFFYVGGRYGISQFEDKGKIVIESEELGDYEGSFGNQNLTANWYEIILGSEAKNIFKYKKDGNREPIKGLILGFKVRVKVMNEYDSREQPIDVYTIPGYGRTFDKVLPVVNLYIKYRIPLSR